MFDKFLRLLLPASWFWQSSTSNLGKLWESISVTANTTKNYLLGSVTDSMPTKTLEFKKWEEELSLPINTTLTNEQRRQRINGKLLETNVGTINSIQTKLQHYGFDLYVHSPFQNNVLVNPSNYLSTASTIPEMISLGDDAWGYLGHENAVLGYSAAIPKGYPLVNIDYKLDSFAFSLGDDWSYLGYEKAILGYREAPGVISEDRIQYPLPSDADLYQYFIYIGAVNFGNFVTISKARRNELERLLLQIVPAQIWIGMLITFT